MSYAEFLTTKRRTVTDTGVPMRAGDVNPTLYPFQRAITAWAARKGRAALFCDCGLGKTFMQLEWARLVDQRTIILAPLCVAEQTVAEAAKLGIPVTYAPDQAHVGDARIIVTNYERLDRFDVSTFGAVVLDESSILKAFDGMTRTRLIQAFARTPFRLCCTATPAPNDISELANHAEFLGLMTRPEFLATWFVRIADGHRTTDHHGWRMKRHAKAPFYRWLASWAVAVRRPSELGYSDDGFMLPPLTISERVVEGGYVGEGLFGGMNVKGLSGRLAARRESLAERVAATANLVHERGVPWMVWCGLTEESTALGKALDAVEVQGSDEYDAKVAAVRGFQDGKIHRIVSKVRILGFGLNFQHCADMAFVGLGDSYEQYYQAIRRCWRFGQKKPVTAHIVISEAERQVVENVRRKEARADELSAELLAHMREFERAEVAA